MSMLPVGIGSAEAGGYQIERSLRFNSADSAYLNRTPASAGNRKTWTWSGWVKRSKLATSLRYLYRVDSTNTDRFEFDSSDRIFLQQNDTTVRVSTQVFRDVSAWYHIVLAVDTTQATANNRYRIYVNGSEITTWTTQVNNAQNTDGNINSTNAHKFFGDGSNGFDGYVAELHFIDGQALDPTSFGETDTDTGVWKPKAYSGSYGTNGFYLKFADNSGTTSTTLGKDSSGNGNNWTPNNFSVTAGAGNDSLVDTPTNYGTDTGVGGEVRGNYCTFSPIDRNSSAALSNGNLVVTPPGGSTYHTVRSTQTIAHKVYFEFTVSDSVSGIGLFPSNLSIPGTTSTDYVGGSADGSSGNSFILWNDTSANFRTTKNGSSIDLGIAVGSSKILQIAYDPATGYAWVGVDDTWYSATKTQIANGTNQTHSLTASTVFSVASTVRGSGVVTANFGQRPFAYTAPSGFKALCTQNLPEPTIKDGTDYFNTVLYTGNGSTQSITGVGFQPDWVWAKSRSSADANFVLDSVRGATNNLYTNGTAAEFTQNTVTAFNADGFSVGSQANGVNTNGNSYVAWNWKANGAGVSNTAGTITSTVSANTDSGFSIVKATIPASGTSDTIGHGLGVAPSMVIAKPLTAGTNWWCYHIGLTSAAYRINLESTAAQTLATGVWNSTAPSSTVVSIGGSWYGAGDAVLYCFAAIPGYSAFGSYTGNGSSDGVFVYTGFRPRFVMVKRSSAAGDPWQINDTARNPSNLANLALHPNASDAEATYGSAVMDILSNGFKLRGSDAYVNASGSTYIYMAFAENPYKVALAR